MDAVTCLAYSGNRMNVLRWSLIRPHLQFAFRFLRDRAIAAYATLLGSDLDHIVKQTSDQRIDSCYWWVVEQNQQNKTQF